MKKWRKALAVILVCMTLAQIIPAALAANTYTITFDAGGGTVSPSTKSVSYGQAYGPLPTPVRGNDRFVTWEFANGTAVTESNLVTASGPHKLYARWANSSSTGFNLKFDAQGGSPTPADQPIDYYPFIQYGVLPLPTVARAGYTFEGWFTAPNGGYRITDQSFVSWLPERVLYARWTKQIPLTFQDGQTVLSSPPDKFLNKFVTPGRPYVYHLDEDTLPVPDKNGYTFAGWSLRPDGGGKVESTDIVVAPASGGITLYAQWLMEYRVFFDPNGGSGMPTGSQYKTVNRGFPYGTLPLPVRPGYTFKGWYTSYVGGTLITNDTVVELTGDQTLYAKWAAGDPEKYVVTFAANGGSLPMSGGQLNQTATDVIVTNGTTYGTLPTPVRPGYTFNGWYTGSTGGVKITEETLVNLTADQKLYAQWTQLPGSSAITRIELAELIYSVFPEKFALYYDRSVPYTDCGSLTARQLTILAALRDQRVMEAVSGTLFKPNTTLSRAEGARIVSILLGADPDWLTASASLPYSDIYTHGAAAIIEYCQKRGIFPEAAGGSFRPDDRLSRTDAEVWLNNARAASPAVDNSRRITLPSAIAYEFYRCDLKDYFPNGVRFYAEDSLPYGLSLSTAGILSDTPNVASTYNFAVNAVDSAGRSTRLNLRLYVGTDARQSWTYWHDATGDPGYEIIQPIENLRGGAIDSVLVSRGPYLQLKGVYLDGDLLVDSRDYVVSQDHSYHTHVMLYKLTLDTAGNGSHTVTLRFVDDDGFEKYASQSFTLNGSRGRSTSYAEQRASAQSGYAAEARYARDTASTTKSKSNPSGTVGRNVAPSSATVRPVSTGTAVDTDSVGKITIDPDIRNGYVSLESRNVRAGQMATLTVTPVYGYRADSVTVTSSNGNAVHVDHLNGNQYTFIMPNGDAEASAKFSREFTDVSPSAWYYDAAVWASDNGIVSGAESMTFNPDRVCTRAEMLTFLWRAKASPASGGMIKFTDVPAGSYYEEAVRWALNTGIVKGGGKKKFNPNQAITRADAVTFLYRAAGSPATAPTSRFTDVNGGAYYAKAVEWAVARGVASGKGSKTFSPDAACTRAEVVTFLYRAMK